MNTKFTNAGEKKEIFKTINQKIKNRIVMWLTIIDNDFFDNKIEVIFNVTNLSRTRQRFRINQKQKKFVIVKYFYYNKRNNNENVLILQRV